MEQALGSALSELMSLSAYRQSREHVFPSSHSLDWYIRQHKAALVDAGALLLIRGAWQVMPKAFDTFVLDAGKSDARQLVSLPVAA